MPRQPPQLRVLSSTRLSRIYLAMSRRLPRPPKLKNLRLPLRRLLWRSSHPLQPICLLPRRPPKPKPPKLLPMPSPKMKSKKQVGLLLSKASPLSPSQQSKLKKELHSGKVRVKKGR